MQYESDAFFIIFLVLNRSREATETFSNSQVLVSMRVIYEVIYVTGAHNGY